MLCTHRASMEPPTPTGQEDQHHDPGNEDPEANQFGHRHLLPRDGYQRYAALRGNLRAHRRFRPSA
jgi:hypothetical protein